MKKIALFMCMSIGFSVLKAQDCTNYWYMTNNAEVEMTVYDKKGKESGVQTWKVSEVKKEGNGLSASIHSTFTDDKGKEITNSTGTFKCVNGMLQADIRMAMPTTDQMQGQPTGEASMDIVYLEYPYSVSVGQSLKDATFKMDMKMNTGMNANVTFKEENRQVTGQEKITTPAGTWNAYIISYDGNAKTQMGPMGIPFNFKAKEWFVPGVGIVKTESYSKNGKLMGSTLITSIKK